MPIVNEVVSSLSDVRGVEAADCVLLDADDTVFRYGSAELYPDVGELFERFTTDNVVIVSGNASLELKEAREQALAVKDFFTPRIHTTFKYGSYKNAIQQLNGEGGIIENGAVIGNRILMDVATGRLALWACGVKHTQGVWVRREDEHRETFDRLVTAPVHAIAGSALRFAGIEHMFVNK